MLRGRGSVSDRHKRKGNSWSRIIFVPWQLSHDAGYTIKERLCLKNTGIWWVIFFILFLVNQSGRQCTDRSKVRIQEDSLIHTICSMEFDLRIVGVGRGGILSVSGKKWIPWNYTALLILLQITTLAINYNVQQNITDPANRHWTRSAQVVIWIWDSLYNIIIIIENKDPTSELTRSRSQQEEDISWDDLITDNAHNRTGSQFSFVSVS